MATTWRDLGHRPDAGDDRALAQRKVEAELADWALLWKTAHDRLGCQIIQNNFDVPPWRLLVIMNHVIPQARPLCESCKYGDARHAPPYVTIHDIDHPVRELGPLGVGRRTVLSSRQVAVLTRAPGRLCPQSCLVDFDSLGAVKKCLVLDLDNTLWGGVIGDDGLTGIRLGQGDPESESFVSFQRYVKGLRKRGVILAVCSKNTDAVAREVFQKHPEMVLRLSDIACFLANWDDKATNLARIAAELNIGLNSLVFVDDNPAERSIVRRLQPEVAVPELPADPAGYIMALERHRYFQTLTVSAEDLKRTDYYRDGPRPQDRGVVGRRPRWLLEVPGNDGADRTDHSRDAGAERPVDPPIQSVQPHNAAPLRGRSASGDGRPLVADTHGLPQRQIWRQRLDQRASWPGSTMTCSVIDTWLMSCRVLKRGVEQFLLNHVAQICPGARLGGNQGRIYSHGQKWSGSRPLRQLGVHTSRQKRRVRAHMVGATFGQRLETQSYLHYGIPSPWNRFTLSYKTCFAKFSATMISSLPTSTTADDIDGWDSMMHINLM